MKISYPINYEKIKLVSESYGARSSFACVEIELLNCIICASGDTCQQISSSGPTPRWCRNTTEHSGNSPRSANNDSSSSLIGNTISTSDVEFTPPHSENIGLSRTVDVVVSISPNHRNSSPAIIVFSLKFANLSSDSASGSGSGSSGGVCVKMGFRVEDCWWWLFLEGGGQEWLCSAEQVMTSMVGSTRLLSTCFLAWQPFELLHR